MVGVLSEIEIESLLNRQRFAHLGCHADGRTYVVPISYAVDGDHLVCQTTPGLKTEMMRKNPEVCVQIEDIRSPVDWESAVLWGEYMELDGVERARAMGLLIDRHGAEFQELGLPNRGGREVTPPRLDSKSSHVIVYRIHIREKTGRYEKPDR